MMKRTRRRLGASAWLAFSLLVVLPTVTQAQLFPNRTIRRERPSCATEPPFNAQVRRDYFGYYPTCWSRFPAGWQCPCPNPELPDMTRSIAENGQGRRASQAKRAWTRMARRPTPMGNPDEMNPNPARDPQSIPLPNNGRSAFDMDPSPNPKLPDSGTGNPDPFETPKPNPNVSPKPQASRPSNPTGLLEMPKLPETTPSATINTPADSGSMSMTPEATLDLDRGTSSRGPTSTRSVPAATFPPSYTTISGTQRPQPETIGSPAPAAATTAPAQAPRRRGFLGGLFGSGNTRTR